MVVEQIASFIHPITEFIRSLVASVAGQFADLVLLGLSLAGGWYLAGRYPKIEGFLTIVMYGLIIFLVTNFV